MAEGEATVRAFHCEVNDNAFLIAREPFLILVSFARASSTMDPSVDRGF
jgi:hypothetical protein